MYPLKIKEKYDPSKLNSLGHRFSVVYLGTYLDGDFTEYAGSHPGIDIRPETPNQDVFAVLDAKVWKTGEDAAYGKYVFLEHVGVPDPEDMSKTTTLYSCYQHLSEVCVSIGDSLKEGDKIGKTGNTGISFGEHLHFQMDKKSAPYHAYWPYTGAEVRAAGVGFSEGVNIGLGKENAMKYTLNPLVYLDAVELRKSSGTLVQDTSPKTETKLDVALFDDIEALMNKDLKPQTNTPNVVVKNEKDVLLASLDIEHLESKDVKNTGFSDVEKTSEYAGFIEKLVGEKIFSGFSDNTFRPLASMSRAELLKVLLLAKKVDFVDDQKDYFVDVSSSSWQKKYVNTAISLGIVSPKNTQFFPNEFISRVEALKMILTLFGKDVSKEYSQNFKDVKTSDWFAKYVQYAAEHDLLAYNSSFSPNKKITRIEVVHILQHIL